MTFVDIPYALTREIMVTGWHCGDCCQAPRMESHVPLAGSRGPLTKNPGPLFTGTDGAQTMETDA